MSGSVRSDDSISVHMRAYSLGLTSKVRQNLNLGKCLKFCCYNRRVGYLVMSCKTDMDVTLKEGETLEGGDRNIQSNCTAQCVDVGTRIYRF